MSTIHVARGAATAPTEMASYDAALADANVHNYNLVPVSSVVPAGATVEVVDAAPDLGPAGNRLTVVQARATTAGPGEVAAGLGWSTGPGPGLFYEASGGDVDEVAAEIRAGLDAGEALRDWAFTDREVTVEAVDAPAGGYATVVVVAAYGESEPII
ncbi:pyruvoyl-dependent arginine decarboxylase [Halegenticoccus tardaugens]|uniref:pyruvoyl-dependent arginine decarboxylase n=1 Tax=Halegenticoccus tardaugens TaxID=2071624 RepID=UPI00100B09E3|nr:pyruvoyl-dependent arginine decarboxylase [Halegenticoccus tardaugens]